MQPESTPIVTPTPMTDTAASRRVPRWAVAAIVLQSLTLLCVFASNGSSTASGSGQFATQSDQERRGTIPNAAQQRAEQTKLLATIASELEKSNGKLDSLEKLLRSGDLEIKQPAGGQ